MEIGRSATPRSAALVALVAGPEAAYITGASLTVDGGTNARREGASIGAVAERKGGPKLLSGARFQSAFPGNRYAIHDDLRGLC